MTAAADARPRIGLEIHIYVRTRAKMFCACPADPLGSPAPNTYVCETCTGQPGARPMAPNAAALAAGIRVARALGCRIRPATRFLRKHYWYPDLPSNYQRTSEPFAEGGTLAIATGGSPVRIREIHWEEDPGAYDLDAGLVDYDRSGMPLLEIVTEPDLRSAEDARAFLQELAVVLRYLGCWREEAGVKTDVNVSLEGGARVEMSAGEAGGHSTRAGARVEMSAGETGGHSTRAGARVEIKNVTGFRNAERAAAGEIARQRAGLAEGRPAVRETRGFDEASGETSRLRSKEEAVDYRFFPDPDLPPLADLDALAPPEEGPLARRARLAALAGVEPREATPLVEELAIADAFELAAARAGARLAFEFLVRDVRAELAYRSTSLAASKVTPADVAELVACLAAARVTAQVATRVLREALDDGDLATRLGKETAAGLSASGEVARAALAAVAANPKAVADWHGGKAGALNFLVGQAMKVLKGRGKPDEVRAAVEAALARR